LISYNQKEFESMQADALRRVREMQKRASFYVNADEPVHNTQNASTSNPRSSRNPQGSNIHNQSQNSDRAKDNQSSQHKESSSQNPFSQLFGSKNNNQSAETDGIHSSNTINNFLKDFKIDQEKLFVLLLIYLLYKNGADFKLLIALGYLLI